MNLMTADFEERDFPGRNKKVGLIGVPQGFGAGQYGSELGVTAIRYAQIRGKRLSEHLKDLGYDFTDYGDAPINNPQNIESGGFNQPKYLAEMIESSGNSAGSIRKILEKETAPIILGGDHSIAIGTFSGVSSYFHQQGKEVGLIWFDAHADINTPESSPSGNIHGMPLATLLGRGIEELVNLENFAPKLNPKYFVHIGARDLDQGEKRIIREMGLQNNFFTMSDVDRYGMFECVRKGLAIASQAPAGYAVTFDVDILDPRFAPGSGTLVRGGITYREAHLALEMIHEAGGMKSFEIVEVNPTLDSGNVTVELAGELILSAFGKTIL